MFIPAASGIPLQTDFFIFFFTLYKQINVKRTQQHMVVIRYIYL